MSLGRDVLAYVPVKIIPAITGLLSIVILTRNLTPEEYGRYAVVIAVALLLVQLAGTWLSNAVLYLYSEYSVANKEKEFRRQTTNLQLVLAVPASGIACLMVYAVTHNSVLAMVGGVLVLGQITQAFMMTFLQASRTIYTQAIVVGCQSLSQIVALCVLMYSANGNEISAVIAVTLGFVSGNVVLIVANRRSSAQVTRAVAINPRKLIIRLLSYGSPMCIWFFATQFYTIGDRILLQFYGMTAQLGQYSSFRDLATGCAGFLTMPLLMASHPIIMANWKEGAARVEIEKIVSGNVMLLSTLFTPIIIMTDIIGEELVAGIFGARYSIDKTIMILVVISIFIGSITMYWQKGLEASGRTMRMAMLSLFTAGFFLCANLVAIPSYGVHGSAVVVVLSYILYLSLVAVSTRKILTPRIPIAFWMRLIVWALLVECILRVVVFASRPGASESTILAINICGVSIGALLLFATDSKIRHVVAKIAVYLKKR